MGYDFKQAAGVKLSEKGQYLSDGNYVLKIKRNFVKRTRDNKDLWIAECVVVESDNPAHKVGTDRSWTQNLNDPQVGFRAVKGFIYAASGLDSRNAEHKVIIDGFEAEQEEEITDSKGQTHKVKKEPKIVALMNQVIEDPSDPECKNSLKDALVRVEVKTIKTKKDNKDFGLHIFTPYVPKAPAPEEKKAA